MKEVIGDVENFLTNQKRNNFILGFYYVVDGLSQLLHTPNKQNPVKENSIGVFK